MDRSDSLVYFYGQCENIELLQISLKLKNICSPETINLLAPSGALIAIPTYY